MSDLNFSVNTNGIVFDFRIKPEDVKKFEALIALIERQGAIKELEKFVNELKGIEKIIDSEFKGSNSFYAVNSLRITKEKELKEGV